MAVTINGSTGIEYDDNVKHVLGTGDDLEIYHDGDNTYLTNTTGNLILKDTTGQIFLQSTIVNIESEDGEAQAKFTADAGVELYYNNVKKLWTESWGINIDGNLALGDGEKLICGGSDDLQIYHDAGGWNQIVAVNDHPVQIKTATENMIKAIPNGGVELYHNNAKKFETTTAGNKFFGDIYIHTGGSSQINFYDVDTHTITNYTSSTNLRWWDQPNSDVIMELQQDGDLRIDGSYSSGGVDYAEYFESTDGSAIPVGTTVVLDNGKVRAATDSETPLGVIRPKTSGTSVTGGLNELKWQGKYLVDDYDGILKENATFCTWKEGDEPKQCWKDRVPTGVTIPDDAVETTKSRKKLNPSFDASKTYVPRSQRVEWNCVGLLGQIPITKGQVTSTNWIKMKERSSTVELWMVK